MEVDVKEFKDIEVSFAGPIFPDFYGENDYLRTHENGKIDELPESSNQENLLVVNETLLWCGYFIDHYGHFVADSISRMAQYSGIKGKLCFSVTDIKVHHTWENSPSWFKEIIEFFGYTSHDVYFISEPFIAKKMYAAPQLEYVKQKKETTNSYLDLLDKHTPPKQLNKKTKVYYISREGLKSYLGKIAGESYLEQFLEDINVRIIRPETLSIKQQLDIYAEAKMLIFAEGSAYHTLQLLGHNDADVLILKRREFGRQHNWVYNTLNKRCNTLEFSNFGGFNIPGLFGTESGKVPEKVLTNLTEDLGIAFYDEKLFYGIENWLLKHGHDFKKKLVDEYQYAESLLKDYENHLNRECCKVQKRYDYLNAKKKN
jgi:hypothetical protein